MNAVKRRDLLVAAGAILLGGTVHLPTRLGTSDVKALAASVESLRSVARQTGGYSPGLVALAERGEALARLPGKDAARTACLRIACESWTVAGWTAADAGKRAQAWSHYDRALGLTEVTDDAAAATKILYFTGTLESDAGRFNEGLRLYQLASIRALDAPASVRDMLLAPIAFAYAALGRGDLSRDYIARALDVEQDAFLRANALTWVADAYALTGHLDRSHAAVTQAIEAYPEGSQRSAVLAELTLAELHRRTGEQDADTLIAGVRQRVEQTASVRAKYRLAVVDGTLSA